MHRSVRAAMSHHLIAAACLSAQERRTWHVLGDTTSGKPRGCNAAAGISAITDFFAALNASDSLGLLRATGGEGRHVRFNIGRFIPSDTFVITASVPELMERVRKRAVQHERFVIQSAQFNGWGWGGTGGPDLQIGPIYVLRSADDLGPGPLPGVGKGVYRCGAGLVGLGIAPRQH